MSVMIIGGGIGGLVTAITLHAQGVPVTVYEQVAQIRPLGVGINLLPHAVKVLADLGLEPALATTGVATAELRYYSKRGQLIWAEARGLEAGYPVPQYSIHRGELHMILLQAALERLGSDRIKRDRKLVDFYELPNGQEKARFADKSGAVVETDEADILIAADGIHSAVRATFVPNEGPPKWNGCVLWRGITDRFGPFLTGRSMIMAGHQNQKFVCYPISRQAFEHGQAQINWIAELRYDASTPWNREDWNRPGRPEDFLPAFESWVFDWLDVPALIRANTGIWEFPMVDRDPLSTWTRGPVTLLGDAAHPMYPIGSNGASQAILDAECLGRMVKSLGPTAAALTAYEAERLPKTAAIVLANRGNGPEQVMQLAEERAPDGFKDIDEVVPLAEREAIAARYKQIAGFVPIKQAS
ncbi:MAG: flavin-dependent oxidoreductase [Alphaproteobacteria bacterium]